MSTPPNGTPTKSSQVSALQIVFASILSIGLLLGINFSSRIADGQRIQRDRTELEGEIATLEAVQVALEEELVYVQGDEYVANWARSEGKMVRDSEVLVIPVPAGVPLPTPTPAPPPIDLFEADSTIVENWRLWWALFLDGDPPF